MKNFVIVTDSSCDLNKELRDRANIEYLKMRYIYGNVDVPADLDWVHLTAKQFYDKMREGVRFTSSQVIAPEYADLFEMHAKEGVDVLYIGCSSALSGSYRASLVAREEVMAKYPEAKIICIDALRASMSLGILVITAAKLKEEGKTIEEVAAYIEENKMTVHMVGTVEDLKYLQRAGRVSAVSAVFGGLLSIKPIIIADTKGENHVIDKPKGRRKSLNYIVDYVKAHYKPNKYQHIAICHADCDADMEYIKTQLQAFIPEKDVEYSVNYIGPAIGASVGPGMISVFFYGDEVTLK
ncbi:MAG: DegV family protein [Clostridia bacterium]|nr:DegV family protein [Clostridia bacterium]